ncbi:MAG: helix-turn-helix domain-containing protein [Stenotrophobium sp.]
MVCAWASSRISTCSGRWRCNPINLADALHLHPRTLQRRLVDEDTNLEALKDEARREVASHYLENSVLPLSQVAALLGYCEQSALTRSCQRWFRQAPLVLRRSPRYTAAEAN